MGGEAAYLISSRTLDHAGHCGDNPARDSDQGQIIGRHFRGMPTPNYNPLLVVGCVYRLMRWQQIGLLPREHARAWGLQLVASPLVTCGYRLHGPRPPSLGRDSRARV